MSRASDTTLAFLLGAITGGIIALLLAPEKGEVTRKKIRDGAADIYGKGRGWADEKGKEVKSKAAGAGDWVKDKVGGAAEGARHQVDAVKGAIAEGKEAYRRELDRG